jgi:hypothetical protein
MKFCYFLLILVAGCEKAKTPVPHTPIAAPTTLLCQLPDTNRLTYSAFVAPLLQNYCLPCHASPGSGGINLDNLNDVKAQAQSGDLLSVIIGGAQQITMPPPPKKQLDSCEIKVIDLWIQSGCK